MLASASSVLPVRRGIMPRRSRRIISYPRCIPASFSTTSATRPRSANSECSGGSLRRGWTCASISGRPTRKVVPRMASDSSRIG